MRCLIVFLFWGFVVQFACAQDLPKPKITPQDWQRDPGACIGQYAQYYQVHGQTPEALAVVMEQMMLYQQLSQSDALLVSQQAKQFVEKVQPSVVNLTIAGTLVEKNQRVLNQPITKTLFYIIKACAEYALAKEATIYTAVLYSKAGQLSFYDYNMAQSTVLIEKAYELAKPFPKEAAYRQIVLNYCYYLYGNARNFEKAIEIIRAHEQHPVYAELQGLLLEVYDLKGDGERAKELAEAILKQEPDSYTAKLILAKYYFEQGEIKQAKSYYQEEYIAKISNKFYAYRFRNLQLQIALAEGDSVAIRRLVKINQEFIGGLIPPLYDLADVALTLKDQALIDAIQKNITTILSHTDREFFYAKLAVANAQLLDYKGQTDQSQALYDEALQILGVQGLEGQQAIADYKASLEVLKKREKSLRSQAKTSEQQRYVQTLKQLLFTLDKLRNSYTTQRSKEFLLKEVQEITENALHTLYAQYQQKKDPKLLELAFAWSEKSKSLLLSDALREGEARDFGGLPVALRDQERSLRQDILFYEAESQKASVQRDTAAQQNNLRLLAAKRKALDLLSKQLEQQYPQYYQLKYGAEQISLTELQKTLGQHQGAMLHYSFGRQYLHVFCIHAQGITWHEIQIDQSLQQALKQFYTQISDFQYVQQQGQKQFAQTAQHMRNSYLLLLEPALAGLNAQIKRLIIIPDGLLHYIPFEILLTEDLQPTQQDYRSLPYLLRQYPIQYHYTAQLWQQGLEARPQAGRGIFAFAPQYQNNANINPQHWEKLRENLVDLYGAKEEVNFLQQHFSGQFFQGLAANERTFKAQAAKAGLLHLAMHGVVSAKNPKYSCLVFSEDGDTLDDNVLYAYEIPYLKFQAELVVLSACETGFGKYQSGEGVMSLGRSFMYAGVPSMVNTLWAINDQASSLLIQTFYQELANGQPKDIALQKAKLAYLDQVEASATHPFYWAAFTLHGQHLPLQQLGNGYGPWLWIAAAAVALALLGGWWYWKQKKNQ